MFLFEQMYVCECACVYVCVRVRPRVIKLKVWTFSFYSVYAFYLLIGQMFNCY